MKISEFIRMAQNVMEKSGDIEMYRDYPDDRMTPFSVGCSRIEIREGTNYNKKTERVEIVKIAVIK